VCAHLSPEDYVASTHRPHGHAIAKGVALRAIMAELFAKDTGCCRGKGGSMHVGDVNVGMFPAIAIVGGGIPIAAGAALASKRLGNGRVSVSFFGEGASNEGAFHETLNMAAIWQLPVVFVCENNLYAASTPVSWAFKVEDVASRASAYGIPGEIVDGNDVLAVYEAAGRAIARARAGGGPTLLECKTYRLVGHSRSDPRTYRTKEEEADWATRDPLLRLASHLLVSGQVAESDLTAIEQEVTAAIDDAVAFAEASPSPQPEGALEHVFFGD
jgi:TPP-dependent pyruvate/acetoin dehydrogenase alpha subunit